MRSVGILLLVRGVCLDESILLLMLLRSADSQTRLTALELISLCAADENPKRFLHMDDQENAAIAVCNLFPHVLRLGFRPVRKGGIGQLVYLGRLSCAA